MSEGTEANVPRTNVNVTGTNADVPRDIALKGQGKDRDIDRDMDSDSKYSYPPPISSPRATGSEHEPAIPIAVSSHRQNTGPPEEPRSGSEPQDGEVEDGFSRAEFNKMAVTLPGDKR